MSAPQREVKLQKLVNDLYRMLQMTRGECARAFGESPNNDSERVNYALEWLADLETISTVSPADAGEPLTGKRHASA